MSLKFEKYFFSLLGFGLGSINMNLRPKITAAWILLSGCVLAQEVKTSEEVESSQLSVEEKVNIYDSIVRIEVSTQVADYKSPWKTGSFSGGTGTGFLIGENLFMTNAHVVSDQRRIIITRHGSATKYKAKVVHVAHDCDLALLEVEDFSEFSKFEKLSFDGVPALESSVRVIGYPVGGDRISVTRGVVSRIDFRPYAHSRVDSHLVVQIDAAINPGNSGGPVLQDGKVVGVAFQGLTQADNTGYMIPTPVIKRFIKDVEDGQYDEYVDLGATTFALYNPAMREALGVKANAPGVFVTSVLEDSSAHGVLKRGDILTAIDGYEIDPSANIMIHGERVDLNEIVERKFVGDKVSLDVLRDGKKEKLTVVLKKFPHARIYAQKYGKKPRYTIKGGLVFQPLDRNLYSAYQLSNPRVRKLYSNYLADEIYKEREDIVILTKVLKNSINSAISPYTGFAVSKINGVEVKSLDHAHELLNPSEEPEHFVIECDALPRPLVLSAKHIAKADSETQRSYGVKELSNLNSK